MCKQAAIENESSTRQSQHRVEDFPKEGRGGGEEGHELAIVPPLPEVGMKGWQASPSCRMRPLGDVHCG